VKNPRVDGSIPSLATLLRSALIRETSASNCHVIPIEYQLE